MRPERFDDVTLFSTTSWYLEPKFCSEIDWFEIADVGRVEEHQPHDCLALVDLIGIASQKNSFHDDMEGFAFEHFTLAQQ
jgi:hypothetical protein